MDADGGVRSAGPARDEHHARPAGQLAERVGHVGGAAFLPAHDELQPVGGVVEGVQHGEVALAGNAERVGRPLREQARHENLPAGSQRHRPLPLRRLALGSSGGDSTRAAL